MAEVVVGPSIMGRPLHVGAVQVKEGRDDDRVAEVLVGEGDERGALDRMVQADRRPSRPGAGEDPVHAYATRANAGLY